MMLIVVYDRKLSCTISIQQSNYREIGRYRIVSNGIQVSIIPCTVFCLQFRREMEILFIQYIQFIFIVLYLPGFGASSPASLSSVLGSVVVSPISPSRLRWLRSAKVGSVPVSPKEPSRIKTCRKRNNLVEILY